MAQLKFREYSRKSSSSSTTTNNNGNNNDSKKQRLKKSSNCYLSLACSIGSFSLACGSLLQLQLNEKISIQRGLFLTFLGFLYFISLTNFFNKYLLETNNGQFIQEKYHLMVSDVMDITNKIVSAIQAGFSFFAGLMACKATCSKSFLYASHYMMEAYAWFGTAYFLYDIWSMYKIHTQKLTDRLIKLTAPTSTGSYKEKSSASNGCYFKSLQTESYENENLNEFNSNNQKWHFLNYLLSHPMMVIHHIFIGTFGFLVIVYIRGAGDCVYSFMFMMEFSTPFVSLRGILSTLGLKNSKIYIFNGFAMLISFFICRILMWPYVFHWYSLVVNKSIYEAITQLPRGCKISMSILVIPQFYWFYLMVKGAVKVFIPSPKKIQKAHKSKNNNLSPETPNNPIMDDIINKASHENSKSAQNSTTDLWKNA